MVCLEQPFIGLSFFTIGSETKYTNQQSRDGRLRPTGWFSEVQSGQEDDHESGLEWFGVVQSVEVRGGV